MNERAYNTPITTKLDKETKDWLEAICAETKSSRSTIIRLAIIDYAVKHAEKKKALKVV